MSMPPGSPFQALMESGFSFNIPSIWCPSCKNADGELIPGSSYRGSVVNFRWCIDRDSNFQVDFVVNFNQWKFVAWVLSSLEACRGRTSYVYVEFNR